MTPTGALPADAASGLAASAPHRAFIGLGANLPWREGEGEARDAPATLGLAVARIGRLPTTEVRAVSRLYRSAPIDAIGPDFHNAVAEILTGMTPTALLRGLQAVENAFGRERPARNAPRTLDLDLLLYDDLAFREATLELPHPRIAQRAFVLRPLAELAPDLVIPGLGAVAELLPAVADQALNPLGPVPVPIDPT